MKAVKFINERFNSARNVPRSVRIMRFVAGTGVAVAVIAIVLAQSIGNGFERVYRDALLDFNAHVIVMGAGEIEEPTEALERLAGLSWKSGSESSFLKTWGWFAPAVSFAGSVWDRIEFIHEDISYRFDYDSAAGRAWSALDPERLVPGWAKELRSRFAKEMGSGIESKDVFLYREALIVGGGAIKGVVVKGFEPEREGSVGGMGIEYFDSDMSLDELARLEKSGEVMVLMGGALARSMGMDGSKIESVRMLIPREDLGVGKERFQDVKVMGTFESGMHDYDSQFMLMDIADARRIFGVADGTVTGIELRITDPERSMWVASAVEEALGPRYRAITWQELNADLIAAVKLEKLVTSLIMGIMLVVAALNIIAALVLTTIHRMREISILKALGLDDRRVERLFIRGGLVVGMRGVVAGLVAGLAAAAILKYFKIIPLEAEIYLVDALPIDISWLICGIITLFCALAIYLTSRIAASRLAKVPPAEGLAQAR